MKLRIRGSSLRLRLTQGEVKALVDGGRVEEETSFGSSRLVYALVLAERPGAPKLEASLRVSGAEARLEVQVEATAARAWAHGAEVGLESDAAALRVLVEKDYACLKDRPHEDDTDAFPNPNTTCA